MNGDGEDTQITIIRSTINTLIPILSLHGVDS